VIELYGALIVTFKPTVEMVDDEKQSAVFAAFVFVGFVGVVVGVVGVVAEVTLTAGW